MQRQQVICHAMVTVYHKETIDTANIGHLTRFDEQEFGKTVIRLFFSGLIFLSFFKSHYSVVRLKDIQDMNMFLIDYFLITFCS